VESALFSEPQRDEKYRESLRIQADTGEMAAWMGNHLLSPREQYRLRVTTDLQNVESHVQTLRDFSLNEAEQSVVEQATGVIQRLAADVRQVLFTQDSLGERELAYEEVLRDIDAVLDDQIQPATQSDLIELQRIARADLARSRVISSSLIGVLTLLVLSVALVITRRSSKLYLISVVELRAAFARLQASEVRRGTIFRRLVTAQEEERGRIARELHDQLGQDLTAMSLGLASLAGASPDRPPLEPARLEETRNLQAVCRRLQEEVSKLAWRLRPALLDDLGLDGALSNLVEGWSRRTGVLAELYCDLKGRRLRSELETTFYRIVQEALNNISKHARARSVDVVLQSTSRQVRVSVEDDGCGFNAHRLLALGPMDGHFGLLGMKERIELQGGTIQIDSAIERGTVIVATIPVTASTFEETTA
jgi:signal transduction histidine kinase